jgi:hypothetical protein
VECGEEVQGNRSVLGRAMGMYFHGKVELAALQGLEECERMYRGNADLWEVLMQRISLLLLYRLSHVSLVSYRARTS